MRIHVAITRAAPAGLAIVLTLLATGCSDRERDGHGSVGRSPDFVTEVSVPDYVSYAAGDQLEGVTSVGMTTSFPADSDWLTIEGGGELTIEMTDVGCSLLLRQGGSADLGVEFIGEDATDTVATMTALVGSEPESTRMPQWTGNDGSISVDALVFLLVSDDGEQIVAVARAFGSLDAFVYAELRCSPGISADVMFESLVAPYLQVSLR